MVYKLCITSRSLHIFSAIKLFDGYFLESVDKGGIQLHTVQFNYDTVETTLNLENMLPLQKQVSLREKCRT